MPSGEIALGELHLREILDDRRRVEVGDGRGAVCADTGDEVGFFGNHRSHGHIDLENVMPHLGSRRSIEDSSSVAAAVYYDSVGCHRDVPKSRGCGADGGACSTMRADVPYFRGTVERHRSQPVAPWIERDRDDRSSVSGEDELYRACRGVEDCHIGLIPTESKLAAVRTPGESLRILMSDRLEARLSSGNVIDGHDIPVGHRHLISRRAHRHNRGSDFHRKTPVDSLAHHIETNDAISVPPRRPIASCVEPGTN